MCSQKTITKMHRTFLVLHWR